MPRVVAVRKGNQVVVAADTQENFGDWKILRATHVASKILRVGSTYVAMTGWGLYDNILRDYLARMRRPRIGNEREVFSFFVAFRRQLHKQYSFVNDQVEEQEPSL